MLDRAAHRVARVHEVAALGVGPLRGEQGVHHGDLVHLLGELGEVLGNPHAVRVRVDRLDRPLVARLPGLVSNVSMCDMPPLM